jgi:hypothetical protein
MKNSSFLKLTSLLMLASGIAHAQLILTPVGNFQAAVQNDLLGPGVTVNNVTYNGSPNTIAEFSGSSSLGISNGLFLTSGTCTGISNPASFFSSSATSGLGDSDLQSITTGGVMDAAVLEFDFKVQGDSVKFNFVFASEEYNDYVGSSFNDVFGFFISGPGITGNQNIALIPGSSSSVSINNVNNGYSAGASSGPCTNCAYYHDNFNDTTVAFDGFTTVLTAVAAVQPCTFYHIKLAVCDVGDQAFDSGVFLEANSFTACPLNVFNGLAPVVDTLSFCNGSSLTLSTGTAPGYLWSTGATTQSITVNQPGTYNVTINAGSCYASSSQIIVVTDTAFVTPSVSQNGTALNSSITNPNYTYEWFKDGIAVFNSDNPQLVLNTGGCYKVMITDGSGCTAISDSVCITFAGITAPALQPFHFNVSPNPVKGNPRITFDNTDHELFYLHLYNSVGKEIMDVETYGNEIILVNVELVPGVYFAELENPSSKIKARTKFIIQK